MFSIPRLCYGKVYVTVPGWWSKYGSSRLLYVATVPVLAYCSGLYKSGGNGHDRVITFAKIRNLVTSLAPSFHSCKYRHANHSTGYTQFGAHEGGFIVRLPASLVKKASSVGTDWLTSWWSSDFF